LRALLLIVVSLTPLVAPDSSVNGIKIVTRQVTGSISDTKTEYLTASSFRSEWQTHLGDRTGPPMASIVQRGSTNRVFLLDLQAHEYIAMETDSQGVALGAKRQPMAYSAGTLQIWIESTDTGERQTMFGHIARHIITRERRIATPGSCSRSSESETDGWYIDEGVMPEWRRNKKPGNGVVVATVMAVNAGSSCIGKQDHIDVHRAGVDPGFPLKITTTMKSEVPELNGGTRLVASTWGSEVMELREGALEANLFEVPSDFRRVEALKSWDVVAPPRRQLSGWEWIKEKLAQLFQ
jgi:hypothetical protein